MLGKLKRLFVVEDTEEEKKAAQQEEQASTEAAERPSSTKATSTSSSQSSPSANPTPRPNPSGKPSKKFIDILLKAVESNNLDGFDYLEFKNALQNLSSVDMDDSTRYKSALAMATTMGKKPSDIINTAQHYLSILKQEDQKFHQALDNQKSTKIVDREQLIKTTEKNIEEKLKMIEKLKAEIEAEKKSLGEIRDSINKEAAKVQATHDGFKAAYAAVTDQIIADIEAIKRNS